MIEFNPWSRSGHKRLYVNDGDEKIGYLDLLSGDLVTDDTDRLRSALTEALGTDARPSPVSLGGDLAMREPGSSIRDQTSESYAAGRAAEQRTAGVLSVLSSFGWRTLHSLPLSDKQDLDHLIVGPTGIHPINTKTTSYAVELSGDTTSVAGWKKDWQSRSRREERLVAQRLEVATGIEVDGLVCGFVSLFAPEIVGDSDVVIPGDLLASHLERMPRVLGDPVVEVLFAAARREDTWTRALA